MNLSKKVKICDLTLRDGNHAVKHKLQIEQIVDYCKLSDELGFHSIEVGHGNGIGASTLQLGQTPYDDFELIQSVKRHLRNTKLSVHMIPGYARLDDVSLCSDAGVDIIRVATHCSEANLAPRYIEKVRQKGMCATGVLMMTHMLSPDELLNQSLIMKNAGAQEIILMDSAGAYLPEDVENKVGLLAQKLGIPLGFHAHNNLGLAISNSILAVQVGASIVDGCILGFGAGAGNAQLEVLVSVLEKTNYQTDIDSRALNQLAEFSAERVVQKMPHIKPINMACGLYGLFGGFEKPLVRSAENFGVCKYELAERLGKKGIIAGQEDLIVQFAEQLQREKR